jgi:hypothetical protein
MYNSFFSGDKSNSKWFQIIDGLLVSDRDMFFSALYMAMTNHPTYVIMSDMEGGRKGVILNAMLDYFENKEEFEKCAAIYNIKKQIDHTC